MKFEHNCTVHRTVPGGGPAGQPCTRGVPRTSNTATSGVGCRKVHGDRRTQLHGVYLYCVWHCPGLRDSRPAVHQWDTQEVEHSNLRSGLQ